MGAVPPTAISIGGILPRATMRRASGSDLDQALDVEAADGALDDFGLGSMPVCLIVLRHQRVARAALVDQPVFDRRALDGDDGSLRVDVLGAVRTRVAVRAQPQVVVADLRDAFLALGVADVFDEAIGVRDRGRAGKRRIDADHRAERVARRAHHAVGDGDELVHVFGRDAALGRVVGVFVRRLQVGFEARVLVPERVHVDDQVLHGLEVRHRVDRDGVVAAMTRVARASCTRGRSCR